MGTQRQTPKWTAKRDNVAKNGEQGARESISDSSDEVVWRRRIEGLIYIYIYIWGLLQRGKPITAR